MHISESVFKKGKIFYFFLAVMVVAGVYSFIKLGKLEDPEIAIVRANIITVYPGASAHDVELKVTNVLEDELSAMANINSIKSRSEANVSIIEVELEVSVPQKQVQQRWEFMRRKLDLAAGKLPEGTRTPIVIDDIGDVYGMFYAMRADDGFSYEEMENYAGLIERKLLEIDGVSKIDTYGEQDREISIELSADKMSHLGVYPIQVIAAIKGQTSELYSGAVESGSQMLRVKVDSKTITVDQLKDILITGQGGSVFKLEDLAKIESGYKQPLRNTLFVNNQKAIGIAVSMESGDNVVELGERVEAKMAELRSQIPAGIEFEKVFFQPEKVTKSITGFMWNLILSVLIVVVVLMITMGFRGGVIIGIGLTLTILATFPILMVAGGTLQRISLGAFIVAMGMLVDNSIVILDGILIEVDKNGRRKSSFTKTAKQTAMPLFGATVIAISAFLPVFLSPDTAGEYTKDLFVVLAISLSVSWILALTQVPMFAAFMLKGKLKKSSGDDSQKPLYRLSTKVINGVLKHRTLTLVVSIALLIGSTLIFKDVKRTFFPDFDYNQFYIEYSLPKGSTPDMVNRDLKKITNYFNSYDEVEMVVTSHGMTPTRYCLVRGMMTENADNYGELIVNFKDYDTMLKMKPIFSKYLHDEYPDAMSRIRKYNLSIKSTHTVEAQFSGPDPAILKRLSSEAKQIMSNNQFVDKYTVCDDWEPKVPVFIAHYDEVSAQRVGATRSDVSNAILAATDGLPIGTIYQGEEAYPLTLKVRDKDGKRIEDLNDIPVWNTIPSISNIKVDKLMGIATGSTSIDQILEETVTTAPLSSVTDGVAVDWEEAVVRRVDGERTIQAQCDPLEGYSAAKAQASMDQQIRAIELPEGYSFKWIGEADMKDSAMKNIIKFVPLTAGLIILILLLLFNDYRRPLIVLLCLPMSAIGIIPGLLVMGQPFSFIAIVGVLGLTGMIIKNAIVLLDEIELRLKDKITPYQAIVEATVSRVRPVVMASLTTILGMIPLLADPMYGAMAVAVISGLVVGTVITLLFIPLLYSLFYNIKIDNSTIGGGKKMALTAIVLLFTVTTNAQDLNKLTLEECRSMALETAEDIQIADKLIEKSEAEIVAAKSLYLPNISASATGIYKELEYESELYLPTYNTDATTGTLVPDLMLDPTTGSPIIGTDGNPIFNSYGYLPIDLAINGAYIAGISVDQPIYMGGKIIAGNTMAKLGGEIAKENLELKRNSTISEVDQSYWLYISVREKVKLAKQYKELIEELLKVVTDSYEMGMVNNNKLLKVKVDFNKARLQLQKAESGLSLSRMALCRVIGLPLDSKIDLADSNISDGLVDLESLGGESATERVEYKIMEKQVEVEDNRVRLVAGDYLPSAGVSAGYNYVGTTGDTKYTSSGISVIGSVKIPIVTFGEGRGKIRSARSDRDMKRLELKKVSELLQLEIEQVKLDLIDSSTRVEISIEALAQAEENLRVSHDNYELGMETIVNLLSAQTEWQSSYSDLIEAQTQLKLKESGYLRVTNNY